MKREVLVLLVVQVWLREWVQMDRQAAAMLAELLLVERSEDLGLLLDGLLRWLSELLLDWRLRWLDELSHWRRSSYRVRYTYGPRHPASQPRERRI